MNTVRLGISPCPNDTFIFHGLLSGRVTVPGLTLDIQLADVERLNKLLIKGSLDVAKASFPAAAEVAATHFTLPCGGALGSGVGPILLAPGETEEQRGRPRVLLPGEHTMATHLWRLFHGDLQAVERHVRFDRIMPLLRRREAEFGVCIHEGRFTFQNYGLTLLEDLGTRYEVRFKQLLPLGGIFARADLGREVLNQITTAIRASLAQARRDPAAALLTQKQHARELDDKVIAEHVRCYVNAQSERLDAAGVAAIACLEAQLRCPLPKIWPPA